VQLLKTNKQWFTLRGHLPVLGLLCFLLPLLASAAPKFEASLDRDTISLGETVTLSLTFEGGNPRNQPTAPPIPNVEYGSTGTSQQIQMVNGAATVRSTYTFELKPAKEGDYTIPAIQSDIDGRPVSSQPLKLKVQKAGAIPHPPGTAEPAFVRINMPKKEFYVGEVVPVEIQCYVQNARDVQRPQLSGDGFIVGEMPGYDHQPPRVNVNNAIYHLLTFQVAVRATHTGTLTLGPATWQLALLNGAPDFFGFQTAHTVSVQSDAVEVKVLPIPTANAPASFSGAVGNFSLAQYQAGPTNVSVGDPITLKIRIAGQGSWDTVALPSTASADWREFKLYPPTAKVDTHDRMQIDGSKYFEQVITPDNADVKEIPAFAFSFFDPNARAFRTLQHAGIPIVVRPTAATPQPTIVQTSPPSADQQAQNSQEIVHIKPQLGKVSTTTRPLIQQPAFIAVQAIPALAFMFAFGWRQRKDNVAKNPRLLRQREVARKIEAGLKELSQHAQSNNAAEFYATVFRLLQEQLGERLDLPASGITESVVADLPANSLSQAESASVHELFQLCNQYRYARQQTSSELQSVIEKLKSAFAALQKINATASKPRISAAAVSALCCVLFAINSHAADSATVFNDANRLYEQGKFTDAATAYDKLIQSGVVSPALYFNEGNAWFKSGQIGKAVVAYRKAEQLAPRDPDVRANLQFARNHIPNYIPALPGNRWTRSLNHLSVNEWTIAASVCFALLFLTLASQQIWPMLRKPLRTPVFGLVLLTAAFATFLALDYSEQVKTKSVVVTVPEAVLRRGPFDESQSSFTVRDGSELLVVDSKDNWLQVADAAHHTGWIRDTQLAVVQ
jgi:tetratricopeptide (TPR) repeat protein